MRGDYPIHPTQDHQARKPRNFKKSRVERQFFLKESAAMLVQAGNFPMLTP